ncbi:MAG: hypothetical protein Tsb0033_26030 [Winogradskyella sp.]
MKKFKLIVILILLSSCSTNKSIVGLYGNCGKKFTDCSQIELKSDKTFGYLIYLEPNGNGSFTGGTWNYLNNDTIILNTTLKPEIPKTNYIGKINPELKNKIRIYISDKDGPLEYAIVSINGSKEEKETNYQGMVEFEVDQVKTVTYQFIMNEEEIEIKNPNHNEIEMKIKDQNVTYPEYMRDHIVKIKGRKLILDSINIYKKTKLKNKQWYSY